jgi:uncharacterized protein YndB with AHSA1/START domain
MGSTTHSIDVNAPLRAVYKQWTQFEEFPRFMEGVVEIRPQGPRTLFWKVNVGGKDKQWEAEILEQVPDTRIVWESVDGTQNRGMIAFEPVDQERTRITLTMEYEPEGLLEKAGDALGIPSSQVEGDLKRFRDFIEKREMETGCWGGQIENGESEHSPSGIGRSEDALDVKNGDGMVETPQREVPSQGSETRKARRFSTRKRGTEKTPAEENLPLQIPGPEAELLHETMPLADEQVGGGESSEFYREAGVLGPTHEQIAQRAYELYVARGRTEGYAREDWLEAEKQLVEENAGIIGDHSEN